MDLEHFDEWSSHQGEAVEVLQQSEEVLRKVLHHDPYLTTRAGPLGDLAAMLFDDIETHCPKPARQRSDARERRRAMVESLAANVVLMGPFGGSLAVSFRNTGTSRYDRSGFRVATFREIVTNLEARGWLERTPGIPHKARTLLEPTTKLLSAMEASGANSADIDRLPGAETIILRAATKEGSKLLIDYEDTAETIAMRAEMEAINAYLREADIRFAGERIPPPHLVRIFQIDSKDAPHEFTKYGRLYRGIWETMKRGQRHLLTINGEPLADLDFKAMHVHLAYAHLGAVVPAGDPYDIPGLRRHREGAKKAMSALFSRVGPIQRLSPELKELLPEGWSAARLMRVILEHHAPIAPLLGTDIATHFQRLESDMMVEICLRLAALGVVCLPVHDGLMCGVSSENEAAQMMQEVSIRLVGRALPVETKRLASF